jgi:2-hydroxyglutarate dehydrogenase
MRHALLSIGKHTLVPVSRSFSTTPSHSSDFTHAVVGAGVVGLAIARQLQSRPGVSTVLIEKHGDIGTETSSRNSEVIHAGIYYGPDSLKTKLCVQGKQLLYKLCEKHEIPFKNVGKWVVAQNDEDYDQLVKIHEFAKQLQVPTRFITPEEAKHKETDVRAEAGALESPTTGIVDSHSLMQYLQADFEDKGGITALDSEVTNIEANQNGKSGWKIRTKSGDSEEAAISADTLINSAGLYAVPISNMILPPDRHLKAYYAKGSYYSYSSSQPKAHRLIYPAPVPGHGGLGTHLTLDMGGRIRFGPDIQPIDDPTDYTPSDIHLNAALEDIKTYLPGIDVDAVSVDYCGIRPKLSSQTSMMAGKGFKDFIIKREEGFTGFVNLLGIESPGLTSCLAIAEMVEELLHDNTAR